MLGWPWFGKSVSKTEKNQVEPKPIKLSKYTIVLCDGTSTSMLGTGYLCGKTWISVDGIDGTNDWWAVKTDLVKILEVKNTIEGD